MKIQLTRMDQSRVVETAEKDIDGSIYSELNQHRLDVALYGLVVNPNRTSPGPCYNMEDPLYQCKTFGKCSWVTYRLVP